MPTASAGSVQTRKPSRSITATLEIPLGSDRITAISTLTNHVQVSFNGKLVSETRSGLFSMRSRHQFWVHQPQATQYEVRFETKWHGAVGCTVIRNGQTIHQQEYVYSLRAGRFISKEEARRNVGVLARFGLEGWLGEGRFSAITTEQEALQALKAVASVFYAVGIINVVLGGLIPQVREALADGVAFVLLAFAMHKRRSRVAAILALIQAVLVVGVSGYAILAHGASAIHRILLSIVLLLAAIRGTQATFAYHHILQTRLSFKHIILKSILGVIYGLVFAILAVVVGAVGLQLLRMPLNNNVLGALMVYPFLLGLISSFLGWLPFTRKKRIAILPNSRVVNSGATIHNSRVSPVPGTRGTRTDEFRSI